MSASSAQRLLHSLRRSAAAVVVTAGLATAVSGVAVARESATQATAAVSLAQLPAEAQAVHRKVLAGGPFTYAKDGTVFGNRERLLPARERGHYREYTVQTPGVGHRGARRIVCGGTPPTAPAACWYTHDHYASFRRIAQ